MYSQFLYELISKIFNHKPFNTLVFNNCWMSVCFFLGKKIRDMKYVLVGESIIVYSFKALPCYDWKYCIMYLLSETGTFLKLKGPA